MKSFQRIIILASIIISILGFFIWQMFFETANININNNENTAVVDLNENSASSKMTYGRFLEYLEMGWVKRVDLFDNSRTAVVEAASPELGNRPQLIKVEIPAGASQLISKLQSYNVDFDAHGPKTENFIFTLLSNLLVPIIFIGGLIFLFQRSNGNFPGTGGNAMGFGKSKARFQMDANTGIGFDDVAGIDEAKEEFEEVVSFLKQPERFTTVGAKIPKGVLLVGPPGTGKTLLAKAIAGEAGVPFFSISGSEFVEMFVGIGASRVRDLFKKASENAPCIIFIDEIDAVGRQRGAGVGGGNDEREQTLNQLLTEMDGFQGNTGIIVVAATNRVDILDSALLRPGRFDRQVTVNPPDRLGRLEILKIHAKNKRISNDVKLESIAQRTPGFAGADLANLLNEAAILTARREKSAITIDEINSAVDRVIAGLEGSPLLDNKSKRLIAYHEVGHAIVGTLLKSHDEVQKVTLIPRGSARGLTWFTPGEDQSLISRSELLARIIGTLGGRAAEYVIFGTAEITTGASSDLQQVTSLARQMVTRFGMSNIGPIALENENTGQVFLGAGIANDKSEFAEGIADRIDDQVKEIISHCEIKAIEIMKNNRVALDLLVDILIDKETIDGKEFREILSEYTELPNKNGLYLSQLEN
jgi:cell division protease FtsH|tara:strand:- start:27677 stop:29614 length:1938 start_codon:yes stop_codon:yes gene_type:complete